MSKKSTCWTPVHNGHVYCSSGCGGSCTFAAYQRAKENAASLTRKLGKGWEPRVWENLGWHYGAGDLSGRLNVYPTSTGTWSAFMHTQPGHGGRWVETRRTPRGAVDAAKRQARQEAQEILTLLESLP